LELLFLGVARDANARADTGGMNVATFYTKEAVLHRLLVMGVHEQMAKCLFCHVEWQLIHVT
jgi:hypothetical protein